MLNLDYSSFGYLCYNYSMPTLSPIAGKSKVKLTPKQDAFCAFYFTSRNATQSAIKAGYSPHKITFHSYNLLANVSIKARLAELQAAVIPTEAQVYASYDKRLGILTKIAEHDIETPVSAGHITQAVSEMNKMEHIYSDLPQGLQDNRTINIYITGDGAKEKLEQLLAGERPLLPQATEAIE